MPRCILQNVTCLVLLLLPNAVQPQEKKMLFKVLRDGQLVGWSEVGVVMGKDALFAVSAFYDGAKKPSKPEKASHRSYAEMTKDGVIKRFKRWAKVGKREDYWMVFYYQGVLKIRYERGSPDRAKVRDLGKVEEARPLGVQEPHLAWVLIMFGNKGETTCVSVMPDGVGKAKVEMLRTETITLSIGTQTEGEWWEVRGDCGTYRVFLDKKTKEPILLESGTSRFERVLN